MQEYIQILLDRGYLEEDITRNKNQSHVTINGVKTEIHIFSRSGEPWEFRIGYNNSPEDIEYLAEGVQSLFGEDAVKIHIQRDGKGFVKIAKKEPTDWEALVEWVESLEWTPEQQHSNRTEARVGAIFEGTIFERTKERGATIGGIMGRMVCEAAGMDRDWMLPEYYIEAGEVDGAEIYPDGRVKSIYECQSGIHKGQYLDDLHLNKALTNYLYDPHVISTVERVVILAGGYGEDKLSIIRERAKELSNRERPIKIVLLETVRVEDTIKIVERQY